MGDLITVGRCPRFVSLRMGDEISNTAAMGIMLLAPIESVTDPKHPLPANWTGGLRREVDRVEETVRVRSYRPSDREAIRRLCCNTGFLGNPVDPLFQDRTLFADLFTEPYLEREPEWALVAEAPEWALVAEARGRVIGYLLGSIDPHFDRWLLLSGFQTVSRMLLRLATGRYSNHPRSRKFIRWLLTAGLREQPQHPPQSAHLHFNLDCGYRGRGLAQLLWRNFESRLKARGIKRCYGSFFSYGHCKPELAYLRYGFRCYDRCLTTLFQPEISGKVEVVCVMKAL
jgi:ribosomal protein S18 acetylase RimI-like enzyme